MEKLRDDFANEILVAVKIRIGASDLDVGSNENLVPARLAEPRIPPGWWRFGTFENDVAIPRSARMLYRQRDDLKQAFANPFAVGEGTYFQWLKNEGHID